MRKDNKLMAMLSIWGITLVVMGHSGFTNAVIAKEFQSLHSWIYSFHMPLFFFISGFLYSLTNSSFSEIDNKQFLKKKFNRLMTPYLILGIVIFVIKYVFAGLSSAQREFSIESFFYMFLAPQSPDSTMGFLWYLITLFEIFVIARILSVCGIDLKSKLSCSIVIFASLALKGLLPAINLLNLSNVLWYLTFFLIGIIVQNTRFQQTVERTNVKSLIFSAIAWGGYSSRSSIRHESAV